MTSSRSTPPAADADQLGLPVLAALVDRSGAAVVVLHPNRQVVYGNPAACLLLGCPLDELRGHDLLERVLEDERPELLHHLSSAIADATVTFSSIVLCDDDAEREVVGSAFPVQSDTSPLLVLTLWDRTGPRSATRAGAALVQTASRLGTTGLDVMLTEIAQHVVKGTGAVKCGIVVAGEDNRLSAVGDFYQEPHLRALRQEDSRPGWPGVSSQPAAEWISAMTGGAVVVGSVPGKPVLRTDARAQWEADPVTRAYAVSVAELPYRGALGIPLSWRNQVIGLCTLHLPASVAVLNDSQLAFATALADQAALAVMHARLSAQAAVTAGLRERARLARELHDSVIQALFSMTMHARAAQLAIESSPAEPVAAVVSSLDEVSELIRDALAEMRALIFELRAGALSDEGLVAALRHQAATLSAREGVTVRVAGAEVRVGLDSEIEQQLYRIALEALHNVVKHARAATVEVRVVTDGDDIRLSVADDGTGFDTQLPRPGHLGLSTMAERAASIAARLSIDSAPGKGTVVTVVSPQLKDAPPTR